MVDVHSAGWEECVTVSCKVSRPIVLETASAGGGFVDGRFVTLRST